MFNRDLEERVGLLEEQVAALSWKVAGNSATPEPQPVAAAPMPKRAGREAIWPPVLKQAQRRRAGAIEEDLVGTWFARLGALAILIGAAFAFSWAVDNGLLGPVARVALGAGAGLAFVAAGEWSFRRGWGNFAQAVSGGGAALLYLSALAAFVLYGLVEPPFALTLLESIAAGNVLLALRYDSRALALLAATGAFVNPILLTWEARVQGTLPVDGSAAIGVLSYVLLLDVFFIWLVVWKRWKVLSWLVFAGTWLMLWTQMSQAGSTVDLAFATAFFVSFATLVFRLREESTGWDGIRLLIVNSFVYFAFAVYCLLDPLYEGFQGSFSLAFAAIHVGLASLVSRRNPDDGALVLSLKGLAVAFLTLGIPAQLDGSLAAVAWSVEGCLLLWFGVQTNVPEARRAGAGVLVLSIFGAVWHLVQYEAERLLLSGDSAALVVQVLILYTGARLLQAGHDGWSRKGAAGAAIAANLLTLAWLSHEAVAYIQHISPFADEAERQQLVLSSTWGVYAAALLLLGIATHRKFARSLAIAIFGLTMSKLVLVDLWLLEIRYRTIAFIGLGALLLICSLAFSRFKELLETEAAQ